MSNEVLRQLKADPAIHDGDVAKVVALVNSEVLPSVDLEQMTASATGHYWREASAAQRGRLEQEFGQLVVRTYAGAMTQVKNETVVFLPQRHRITDRQAEVRSEVHGAGDPIPVDYRLTLTPGGWKIVDVSVMGVWLAQTYQGSFEHQIEINGIDGLIGVLTAKNKADGG